jgi:hypothetical protein
MGLGKKTRTIYANTVTEDSNAHAPTPDISTGINHHGYCPENSCSC